jgi:fructose-1,6-bisphosphatase/inositol monophosphatase family enzyme
VDLWTAGSSPGRLTNVLDARAVAEVDRIIRAVADQEIMPRFERLGAADVMTKGEGDLVTIADRAAEEALTRQLVAMLPGSVVVGEEGVAADPQILAMLGGPAPVWIIDPIDGTRNFVGDNPRFSTLVALAQHGELLASWTYAPAANTMATATASGGAHLDGQRLRVRPVGADLRGLDVCAPHPSWLSPAHHAQVQALSRRGAMLSYLDTSGLEYVQLAAGRRSVMVLTWEFPWDHAAGLLLHAEAGGVATTADGSPFRLTGGNTLPFVAAPDAACAAAVHAALAE